MMLWGILALLSHWRRRPIQFLTLILGIALATALWSGVQAINAEARASYAHAAAMLEQDGLSQLVSTRGEGISIATYGRLRQAGWNVSPVIEGMATLGKVRLRLIGIDPLTMPQTGLASSIVGKPDLSAFLSGERLVVSPATAEKLRGETEMMVKIADQVPEGAAFLDISAADTLLGARGAISCLVIAPDQKPDLAPLGALAPDLSIRQSEQTDVARLTDSFHLNLTAFGFLSFTVGLFIVYSATGLAFEQRRGTFRTLARSAFRSAR